MSEQLRRWEAPGRIATSNTGPGDTPVICAPRAFFDEPFLRALPAASRYVATLICFVLPSSQPIERWFGGQRFEVPAGAFFLSENEIAFAAGTTRKVVRGVLEKLQSAGFVDRGELHPSPQCPRLTTVLVWRST